MKYMWHTPIDDKTCHECAKLDGETLTSTEESMMRNFLADYHKNHGKEPCRCYTTPIEQVAVKRRVHTGGLVSHIPNEPDWNDSVDMWKMQNNSSYAKVNEILNDVTTTIKERHPQQSNRADSINNNLQKVIDILKGQV